MPRLSILDVISVISVTFIGVSSQYVPKRHREHAFSSAVDYDESLTWVMKLTLSFLDDDNDFDVADMVAVDIGLVNHGQISSLAGYYVFSHPAGADTKRASLSSVTFQHALQTVSKDEHRMIKDKVHKMLDNHPFVEWYMLQRVVPRVKRTAVLMPHYRKLLTVPLVNSDVSFNDPLYHKQWHLVGRNFVDIFLGAAFSKCLKKLLAILRYCDMI